MKKLWIAGYLALVAAALATVAYITIRIDPFFHYHLPNTDGYFYLLDNQRSQNDGITKHFEYEGLITGTSMTENFKTTEAEDVFGLHFIKVPYAGATYHEINSNLAIAASKNPELKCVIRGLDIGYYFDKDLWRTNLGVYPRYLYDDNVLNDVEYIFNRDVLFTRIYPMVLRNNQPDFSGGIIPFDVYSNWMWKSRFGHKTVLPDGLTELEARTPVGLSQEGIDTVRASIQQNVTALADQYPDITFYYFLTPYSAAWWRTLLMNGTLDRQVDAEQIVIEEILKHENIRLFSFNCLFDITTDLNHYCNKEHYAEWINSLILRYMHDGKCQLTRDNYLSYLEEERQFYKSFDYYQLVNQEDYEDDYYAGALLSEAITGTKPHRVDFAQDCAELSHAEIVTDPESGQCELVCTGALQRGPESELSVFDYIWQNDYVGAKIELADTAPYRYLVVWGRKLKDHGQPSIALYDSDGNVIDSLSKTYPELDEDWHMYVLDLYRVTGPKTLILNGGYEDNTGAPGSRFAFRDLTLY